MRHLLVGAAVVAFAAVPLAAQGNGHGKGGPGGHGNSEHGPPMQRPSMVGPAMKHHATDGPAMHGPAMHGSPKGAEAHGKPGHAAGSMASAMEASAPKHAKAPGGRKDNAHGNGPPGAPSHRSSAARPGDLPPRNGPIGGFDRNGKAQHASNGQAQRIEALPDGRHRYTDRGARAAFDFAAARRGPITGCPPGLARKDNGCQPPGQARQRLYQPGWWGLGGMANGSYAYDNGYLLRLNGNTVAAYLPLLGGALAVGNSWPSAYAPMPVPQYYVDYYDLGPPGGYRYADNVLYRVDPSTAAITSIAALLTGDDFAIGAPLPSGYDIYNVPYPYRSQYPDGPDVRYRYSDGYIYQVDPATRLITAAIDLLTAG
jgi:hypothetical protein